MRVNIADVNSVEPVAISKVFISQLLSNYMAGDSLQGE